MAILLSSAFSKSAIAEQPIFDEMPRWSGGWGFQILQEYRMEREFLDGTRTIGDELPEAIHILHIQGVYTWKKWIRMTAKLPFIVHAERERPGPNGGFVTQQDDGIGDLTLALPLKKYFNLEGRSGAWTVTPSVRIPLSPQDDYEVYDRRWGTGLGFGYHRETHRWIIEGSATGWVVYDGPPNEVYLNFGFGQNVYLFGTNGHVKITNTLRIQSDGSRTYKAGPVAYFRITDLVHTQFIWLHDFYDKQGTPRNGRGDTFRIGVGFVY